MSFSMRAETSDSWVISWGGAFRARSGNRAWDCGAVCEGYLGFAGGRGGMALSSSAGVEEPGGS